MRIAWGKEPRAETSATARAHIEVFRVLQGECSIQHDFTRQYHLVNRTVADVSLLLRAIFIASLYLHIHVPDIGSSYVKAYDA